MSDSDIKRREFLKLSGNTAALSVFGAIGYTGYVPAVSAAASSVELKVLDQQQARLLLSMTRTLFPHDFLSDDYYMKIVAAIDGKASADAETAKTVQEGLAGLPSDFSIMAEAAREDQLRAIDGSPFFSLVYNDTQLGLYSDPDVWKIFGYEGSSVEHGGYINRGFDDLDWLPEQKG